MRIVLAAMAATALLTATVATSAAAHDPRHRTASARHDPAGLSGPADKPVRRLAPAAFFPVTEGAGTVRDAG
jgi:hypothetical protein